MICNGPAEDHRGDPHRGGEATIGRRQLAGQMLDEIGMSADGSSVDAAADSTQPDESKEPKTQEPGGSNGLVRILRGEHLFHEGQVPGAMYLIRKGRMRVYRKEGGVEIDLEVLEENQIIGELSFLDGSLRSASAQAVVDTVLVKISGPAFTKTLDGLPDWLKILLRTLCQRLRTANSKIRALER